MNDWGKRKRQTDRHLSRRQLLGTAAGAAGGFWLFAALSGCQSKSPAATSAPSAPTSTGAGQATAPTAALAATNTSTTTISAASAPTSQPKATAAPAAAPATQLTYATDWTTGARGETLKAAVAKFEKEFPKYTVKVEPIGGDYYDKLTIEISGGTAADIILFSGAIFLNFQQKGALAAIDSYLKALNVNMGDYTVVPGCSQADGKQYGMPFELATTTWYANSDMFQKAGVPLPKEGWDWNDLVDVAKKLTNPSQKQWGINMENSPESYWSPFVLSAGGHFFNSDHTKTALADGDGFEGFKFAVDLVTQYKVSPSPAESKAFKTPQTSDLFAQGRVAMTPSNSAGVGEYDVLVKDRFHWQPIPQPAYPKTHKVITTYNDQPNLINNSAKDVEGAVKFAVFMAGEYVQGLICDFRGSTPVLKKLQTSQRYLKPPPPNMQQIITNLGFSVSLDFIPNWLHWWNAITQAADLAFIGQEPPKEAFQKVIAAGNKVLAQG